MMKPFIIDFQICNHYVSEPELQRLIAQYQSSGQFTYDELTAFLNTVIFNARLKLLDHSDGSFRNLCDTAQSMIGRGLESIGIPVRILDIGAAIHEEALGHSVLIADLVCEGKPYPVLIDITYQQFCLTENCLDSCYIKKDGFVLMSPDPGYVAKKNPQTTEVIRRLLEYGYLPWTKEIAKNYCDTFFLSRTGREEEIEKQSHTGEEYLAMTRKSNIGYSNSVEDLKRKGLLLFSSDQHHYQK